MKTRKVVFIRNVLNEKIEIKASHIISIYESLKSCTHDYELLEFLFESIEKEEALFKELLKERIIELKKESENQS